VLEAIRRNQDAIRNTDPVETRAPATPAVQTEPPAPTTDGIFSAVGAQPTGALTGRVVYIGAGHGWTAANTTNGAWSTQRGEGFEMIEDMGNQDQMQFYANYLWQAGATVVPLRPIGNQTREFVIDNDDANVTFTGSWSNVTSATTYFGQSADAVKFRSIAATSNESATATYTPNVTAAGFYPVYAWALDASTRAPTQTYRVNHSGGSTEVKVNHRWVGKGWVYLGTFHFNAGSSASNGSVTISNKSTAAGEVIADAVRFGNGMGTITRGGSVSGAGREDEAGLYWADISRGVGVSDFYRGGNSEDIDANVGAPTRWAAYMNAAPFGQAVHLSFHSNAGGGRGTVGLYNNETLFPNTSTPNQLAWATLVGEEVNDDLVAIGTPTLEFAWFNRNNPVFARSDFAFGEIRTSANGDEFDSTILEVAFHDDASDAALMRDPDVRRFVGRASYQATVKYFNQFGGLANSTLLPETPRDVRATTGSNGDVTVTWTAPVADAVGGHAATGYRVFSSSNGYGFDAGFSTGATLSYTIPAAQLPPGDTVYLRVAATNAGGESLPSPVFAVRRGASATRKILLVNGFDRLTKEQNVRQTQPNTGGVIDRVRVRGGNTFDYVVQAAEAIEAYSPEQFTIDSVTSRSIDLNQVALSGYTAVIWLAGEQQTATFTPAAQGFVSSYLGFGGNLFVSGSEIAWDLVNNNNGSAFYTGSLRAGYGSDDANTYNAVGAAGSIFAGISLSFDNGANFYNVELPDRLVTANGSTAALTYSGGTGGIAAVQYTAANDSHVVTMGFPFETITTAANRAAVMSAVLGYFTADSIAPTVTFSQYAFQDRQLVAVVFSEYVGASLTPADIVLRNLTTDQLVPASQIAIEYSSGANLATLRFDPFLNDGNYELTFAPGGVSDPAGNALVPPPPIAFYHLGGDANRDRSVTIADFGLLAANFNQTPRDFGQGDFDYNDVVTIADFAILAGNFNKTLPAPDAARALSAAAKLFGTTKLLARTESAASLFDESRINLDAIML
jgi:hypothetical protein